MVILAAGFSVCVHEFSHAYTAFRLGDSTAADAGHLTLNPLKQMGIFSIVMLLIFGFCWGAVPVDPSRVSRGRRILIFLAGPLANWILFFAGLIILVILGKLNVKFDPLYQFLFIFAELNAVLGTFNLLPVPPLDGGAVVQEFINVRALANSEVAKGAMIGMMLLVFYSSKYLFMFGEWITLTILDSLIALVG